MNSLDLYILFPILAGFVYGLFRGFIREVISLASIILGIFCAKIFNGLVAGFLAGFFEISLKSAQPLAFVLIFIVVAIILKILGKIMHNTLKMMSLGIFNSILGGLLGGVKWLLIVSILVNLAGALNEKIAIIDQEVIDNSTFYKPAKNFGPVLWKEIRENK